MQNDNYDVSVFIIDKDNNYIEPYEYDSMNYADGMFVCLTNDELNSDYGFNNSICIYKDWKDEIKRENMDLIKQYGKVICQWQIEDIIIPNNEDFSIFIKMFSGIHLSINYKNKDMLLKCYLDGYLSCQNIMSNITPLLKGRTKEEYIPAIMTAYHTKVKHNGKIERGYLPSIGQLIYMSYNQDKIIKAMNLILNNQTNNKKQVFVLDNWWSSTEYNHEQVWCLRHEENKRDDRSILPLFALQ